LDDVRLGAELADGSEVIGQSRVNKARDIQRAFLIPEGPRALPGVVEAILEADVIIIGQARCSLHHSEPCWYRKSPMPFDATSAHPKSMLQCDDAAGERLPASKPAIMCAPLFATSGAMLLHMCW
jgi:hypothetical protein